MSLHRRLTHPEYVNDCYGCKISTLHIAHSSEWSGFLQKEKVLEGDLNAYARLRKEGLQPEAVTGAANLERTATHRLDIEQKSNPHLSVLTDAQKDQYVKATG